MATSMPRPVRGTTCSTVGRTGIKKAGELIVRARTVRFLAFYMEGGPPPPPCRPPVSSHNSQPFGRTLARSAKANSNTISGPVQYLLVGVNFAAQFMHVAHPERRAQRRSHRPTGLTSASMMSPNICQRALTGSDALLLSSRTSDMPCRASRHGGSECSCMV